MLGVNCLGNIRGVKLHVTARSIPRHKAFVCTSHRILLSKFLSMRKIQSAATLRTSVEYVVIASRSVEERDATSILTDCIVYN